ncbi:MAG: UvrD-helicase domain-containing protein [bacterium]
MALAGAGPADEATLRKACVAKIVASTSKKRIVVAGAGTGKTFTFREALAGKQGKCLALTFINSLATELKAELDGYADVATFHAYAKQQLHILPGDGLTKDFEYYPALDLVIAEDSVVVGGPRDKFEDAFCLLVEDERIPFFLDAGNYYDAVGHNDAVYRVLDQFKTGKRTVPVYDQIVVDEYQDFNALEVRFLQMLSARSPVLIAGDDDQALYAFRHAHPKHLREAAKNPEFERFELPYCGRCTSVIVDAVHDVVAAAKKAGLFRDRVDKQYLTYTPDKGADSKQYPKIVQAECTIAGKAGRNYVGMFVEGELRKMPKSEWDAAKGKYPAAMIIGPKHYLTMVHDFLATKRNGVAFLKAEPPVTRRRLDGYRMLSRNPGSNLGWRLVVGAVDGTLLATILPKALASRGPLCALLPAEFVAKHVEAAALLAAALKKELSEQERMALAAATGYPWTEIEAWIGGPQDDGERVVPEIGLTTAFSAKGLSAGWVFIVGMNAGDLPKAAPAEIEVCQYIVALTRARKKCYLVTNGRLGIAWRKPSPFLYWIKPERRDVVKVDKNYIAKLALDA